LEGISQILPLPVLVLVAFKKEKRKVGREFVCFILGQHFFLEKFDIFFSSLVLFEL
jgi:hypothetical protein